MRILHILKTSEGAAWAVWQVSELRKRGLDVHVILPARSGLYKHWLETGAVVHIAQLDFSSRPWRLPAICAKVRELVKNIKPDLIHTHHVGTTLAVRLALGTKHPTPRVFQVAGPLHLEHALYRKWDLATAADGDYWICTSKCIFRHYIRAKVDPLRLYLSYAGTRISHYRPERTNHFRLDLGISSDAIIVGNLNFIYAPKYYLGQGVGLKCHEDVIDALGLVTRQHPEVVGVVAGGPWGGAGWYEKRLRARALQVGRGRIKMPGLLSLEQVRYAWADYDCAVHVPLSENCGGVIEPLLSAVPTIGGEVGGIPEVILEGVTGKLTPIRAPLQLAETILGVISDLERWRGVARNGQRLVQTMFDVSRTAREVESVYRCVLNGAPPPQPFDSATFGLLAPSPCSP